MKKLPVPILKNKWLLLLTITPLPGIVFFILLYIIATGLYPGGSQADASARGFSWINNYWCNLLNVRAMNGQFNPARPIAIMGMVVLCFSLAIFWIVFARQTGLKKSGKAIIQFSGMLSMGFAMFLFTAYHDTVINLAGFFGLIALIGTFVGLYKSRWNRLLYFGIFNLFLVGLNNYVYYTHGLIIYLPVIQKISFLSFLFWIGWIDLKIYIKERGGLVEGR